MKTIIDKLANFVARNGAEFEKMTMIKQQNNSKFAFLFGGEDHAYYQWKVRLEQGMQTVCELAPLISAFFPSVCITTSSEGSTHQFTATTKR